MNSHIFSNAKMSVKVVDNYVGGTNYTTFCRKSLRYNPIMVSPDFNIMVCNHFGKKAFSALNAVNSRDEVQLYQVVDNTLKYLADCSECERFELLTDYLNDNFSEKGKPYGAYD